LALDPALAGLLGALVGGGATVAGSILGNTQQARHERRDRHEQRKVEVYSNSLRSLLRAAHRRSEVQVESGKLMSIMGKDMIATWFDDLVDAEYWTTVLTTACGSRQRAVVQEAARALHQAVNMFVSSSGIPPQQELEKVYEAIADAARQDIGFVD
jgi:hypothetical protein